MRYRCRNAVPAGIAEIKDYELLFKGSKTGAYLTIEKKKGSTVPVAVWAVNEEDEKRLDRYEGFPRFYYKKEVRVSMHGYVNEKPCEITAFVYIMHEDRKFGIPAASYVGAVLEGYQAFEFDVAKLFEAYLKSEEKANENK